ncbi:MAG: hypothetical protein H0W78_18285 [Planctomycetes bacterium]|nr:hypothetical protein [Planctomycetota bacterium]
MKRALLLILMLVSGAVSAAENLTLAPINLILDYAPYSGMGSPPNLIIDLPGGSDAWVITRPAAGTGLLYNGNGSPISADDTQVVNPSNPGRVNFLLYDDVDTVSSFVFAIGQPGNPNRQFGLCSIILNSSNIGGIPGAFDVFITDVATGAKVEGASVSFVSPSVSLTEVGAGQYRTISGLGGSRSFNVTASGYNALSFTTAVGSGAFNSTARTMINPTPGEVNVSTTASNPSGANPIPFRIFFFKPVNATLGDFTIGDITVSNGTVSSLDGGPDDYTAQVIPTAAGAVQISVAAGVARDNANILNAASNALSVTYDATGPTVTINQDVVQADPATSYPVRFAVQFSESVTDFTSGDVELSGTAGAPMFATVTGSGASYVVEVSGMSGPGTVIATVRADAATGASGPSRESSSSDNVVTWSPPANYTLPTLVRRLNYTAASLPPSETIDIDLGANAWVVLPPRNSNTRLMQVVGAANGAVISTQDTAVTTTATGRVRVGVNGLAGDTSDFFTYALTPPGTANRQFGFVHLTLVNNSDLSLTIGGLFVTLTNGSNRISGATVTYGASADSGTLFTEVTSGVYRLTISNNTSGTIFARAAGFQDVSQVQALTVGLFPEVSLALTPSSLISTITSTIANPTRAKTFPVTFIFSSPVSDFTAGDVLVSNGTFSGFSGSGTTYTGTITAKKAGVVKVEIASGAANASGFACNAAALTRAYDPKGPLVTINQAVGQADPVISGPILFTAQFTAPVTGFTGADVSFSGSTATGTMAGVVTGSGTTYTISVSGMVGDGTVVPSILVDAAFANGHPSAASTSSDNSVTFTPPPVGSPSVTLVQDAGQPDPTPLATVVFRVRFSNPVNGFTAADVQLTGTAPGTLSASVSSVGTAGDEYLVLVGGMTGAGTVIASLPAGAATAQAGGAPTFVSTGSDNQVTYAPVGGSGSTPSASSGSGACGLGSGLAALLAGCALVLLGRRSLR